MKLTTRAAEPSDASAWERMRAELWPDAESGEHAQEIADFFAGRLARTPWQVILVADERGDPVGFAEVSIRTYAEGCRSTRVAYLEGWYVDAGHRRKGLGAALIRAAEAWGSENGCSEFASDADPANRISVQAHLSLGFDDVGLVRCFRKELDDRAP